MMAEKPRPWTRSTPLALVNGHAQCGGWGSGVQFDLTLRPDGQYRSSETAGRGSRSSGPGHNQANPGASRLLEACRTLTVV